MRETVGRQLLTSSMTVRDLFLQVGTVERSVERLEIRLGVMEQNPSQFGM